MVAYIYKARGGYTLTICLRPCDGPEFTASETIAVAGKREANAICKARGVTPYNW